MKNTGKNIIMTIEEILADPSLSELHALLTKPRMPFSQRFPKKHALSLMSITSSETRKLFLQYPNMPIKKVLSTIFEPLTDDIPPALMLNLTANIINIWTELSHETQAKSQTSMAV